MSVTAIIRGVNEAVKLECASFMAVNATEDINPIECFARSLCLSLYFPVHAYLH